MKIKMSDAPDLSHLTAEERAIIESVMMRQKQEEEREHEIVKKKQDEVQILEETIRQRSEQHKKAGVELDATCHICLKTKFADGVGHICYYCQIRCCARCGGKVTLRSNKVIWACILCRKRQELLIKTGQWMNNKGVQENGSERKLSISDQNNFDAIGNDKPRFERSKSASDKENNLNRSGSLLRRQYSEHDDSSYNHRYQPQPPQSQSQPQQFHFQQNNLPANEQQDPSFYKNEISNLFRTHPHLVPHTRQVNNHDISNNYSNAASHQSHQSQQPYQSQIQSRSNSQTQLNMSNVAATAAPAVPRQQSHVPANAPVASNYVEQYPMSIVQQQYSQSHQQPLPSQPISHDYIPQAMPATMMHRNNSMNSVHSSASHKKHKRNNSLKKNLEKQCSFSSSEDDEFNAMKYQHNNYQIRRQDSFSKKAMLEEKLKKFLTNSVSWKITPDGTKMIGHMILKKALNDGISSGSGASILGLKVVGGKILEDGKLGAVVEKVKKGSVADIEGQLQPGDEILEWNRYFLAEKSYQEVYDIISSTKNEPQIELVVSRYVMTGGAPPAGIGTGGGTLKGKRSNNLAKMKPCVTVTCPSSPEYQTALKQNSFTKFQNSVHEPTISSVGGKLKMKLGYDYNALQLVVTIECCVGLNFRPNGHLRNPYAKIFLLPDRSEKSKRRTKTLASTNDPYWNQMFVYSGLRKSDLKNRTLEISVWDYVKYGANDFLGEILVDLHSSILKDVSEWFQLMDHEDLSTKEYLSFHRNDQESIDADFQLTPSDHLSPPSTVSRLSDSDTPSECDIDSNRHSLERIAADAASMSSIGSSSSPPLPPVHDQSLPMSLSPQHVSAQVLADHQLLQQRYNSATMTATTTMVPVVTKNPQAYLDNRKIIDQNIYETQQRQRHRFTNHRSFSPPPEPYNIESPDRTPYYYMHGSRFQSRSATVTPTGSPKKRQLPQVPLSAGQAVFRDRVVHDLEERAHITRHRMRHLQRYRNVASEGWERNYNGLSDSDIATHSSQQYLRKYKSLRSPEQEVFSSDQNDSDLESLASVTSSALSTQSERPRGSIIYTNNIDSNFKNRKKFVENSGPKKPVQFSRSLSNDRSNVSNDGSLSDTATSVNNTQTTSEATESKKSQSTTTKPHTKDQNLTLNKKSHSTNQLSATGRKRRIGFGIKGKSTFTVHRSEEVGPSDLNLLKNSYSLSTDGESISVDDDRSQEVTPSWISNDDFDRYKDKERDYKTSSANSISSSESSVNSTSVKINNENGHQLAEFIDGLGPGQLVGRQVLGSHSLGEIQLSLRIKNRNLEVEVIRARGLQSKPGFKMLPAPYVKLYLVKGKKCIEKLKTISARHTLDPFYQQSLLFGEPFEGCVLQVTVWGDYGRQEGRKVFMGVAQIMLNDLNLSNIVYGWYKLFGTSTLNHSHLNTAFENIF